MNEQTEKKGVVALPAIIGLAKTYDLDAAAFVYTFKQVAMPAPHTDAEFVSCCLVAREHGLNPLTKEIYFMRDKHGKIQAIVGVDGWIKKCNEHPMFDGIEFLDTTDDKGQAVSIRARIFRKDRGRPIEITEYLKECLQQRDKPGPWQTHPNRMLRHKALIQCARIAFGFAGLMDRDEFDQWQAMRDITPTAPALPEIPDIPDVSEISDAESEPQDEPLADEAGFLIKLEDEMALASDFETKQEVWDSNEHLIGRLSSASRVKAGKLMPAKEAAE